ncbi:MAG: hypothetical protein ACKOQ3_08660 [Novosphingobium sp.]
MSKPVKSKAPVAPHSDAPSGRTAEPAASGQSDRPVDLFELRTGLFINPVQVISVSVTTDGTGERFAVLKLSNGETLDLTADEFRMMTGHPIQRAAVAMDQTLRGVETAVPTKSKQGAAKAR